MADGDADVTVIVFIASSVAWFEIAKFATNGDAPPVIVGVIVTYCPESRRVFDVEIVTDESAGSAVSVFEDNRVLDPPSWPSAVIVHCPYMVLVPIADMA